MVDVECEAVELGGGVEGPRRLPGIVGQRGRVDEGGGRARRDQRGDARQRGQEFPAAPAVRSSARADHGCDPSLLPF